MADFHYPETRKDDITDTYHGVEVADPYRWLENSDSEETKAWIEAQNAISFPYLKGLPANEWITKRLTELWDYDKHGMPSQKAGRYFFSKHFGLQNHSVVFTSEELGGPQKVLFDPNEWSEDGSVSLAGASVSEDGKLVAYGKSTSGTDWSEWFVRDIDSGEDLSDHLKWVKFSGASWSHDSEGFFYSRYDEPEEQKLEDVNYYQKLYHHRVGTPQDDDELIYERPDQKEWGFHGHVTDDGRFLVIHVSKGTHQENQVFYRDLTDPGGEIIELIRGFDASYGFVGNDGNKFYLLTDLDAPNKRLIEVDIKEPDPSRWVEVIGETEDALREVGLVGERFFAIYLHDAHTDVKTHDLDGTFKAEFPLPGIGTADGFDGRRDYKETFFVFTSFTDPGTVYRYDFEREEAEVLFPSELEFDTKPYATEQIFYESKDGTRVPMFIVKRRDLEPDGKLPILLTGYGGFDIPQVPAFALSRAMWLEAGGTLAVACLRGGGEYGKSWHEAGMKTRRQNVFDDFIGAAKWLIDNNYTNPKRLAITGGSNGGLLVAAVMCQRPELFGAVIPNRGVLDMLRYHQFTIGWAWSSDYGTVEDPEEFKVLHSYSPLHNLEPGTTYPPALVVAADHDDRVVPGHSFKFAAALQEASDQKHPALIRIETSTGHGLGRPTTKIIEETADIYAFIFDAIGVDSAD